MGVLKFCSFTKTPDEIVLHPALHVTRPGALHICNGSRSCSNAIQNPFFGGGIILHIPLQLPNWGYVWDTSSPQEFAVTDASKGRK